MKKSYLTLKDYAIDFTLSTASAGVQLIPFIGSAINQMTFGYMNSLQVTRIENYLVELSKYLESKAIEQDILNKINEYLTSDEGQEFFYINLEKVTKTRNEHKRQLYRNILLNQSTKFTRFSLDTSEEYLNILDSIKVESIMVLEFLSTYQEIEQKDRNTIDGGNALNNDNSDNESEYLTQLKKELSYQTDELNYFHQQLISNGLAVDDSMGFVGGKPLERFKITEMGTLFLKYLKFDI